MFWYAVHMLSFTCVQSGQSPSGAFERDTLVTAVVTARLAARATSQSLKEETDFETVGSKSAFKFQKYILARHHLARML